GALVDILYDQQGEIPWPQRERWAKQVVRGLCEIHEAGYVQGDFTLSNIVVDADGDAKIIDINRRGCPVGWEPPEIAAKIESNQRIS
ncbi:Protein kinase domain-containing protein, partial [Aspergillus sclerotialis]